MKINYDNMLQRDTLMGGGGYDEEYSDVPEESENTSYQGFSTQTIAEIIFIAITAIILVAIFF